MEDASLAGLLLRLVVSMGVVIGLMLLAARVLRRSGGRLGLPGLPGAPRGRRAPITVTSVQPLTRGAHVAIVRAGGRELVLGVTEAQVTLLHSSIEPRDAIDPRDDVDDDVTGMTTNDDVASARTAHATAGDSDAELVSGLSAWTDALESLREKTVRR